ncbi:MAG: glycosyltransferase family 2 protein, partial [Gemmatimonadota bacterium]
VGARVGFLDGSRLYRVRSYESLGHMWREWGRSIDLKDATNKLRRAGDCLFVALVQGAPLPLVATWIAGWWQPQDGVGWAVVAINATLLLIRLVMLLALAPAYSKRSLGYWLSPTADWIAVLRLILSMLRRPTQWRGRHYPAGKSA